MTYAFPKRYFLPLCIFIEALSKRLQQSMESDDNSSDASSDVSSCSSSNSDLSFAEDLSIASIALSFRAERLANVRMNWHRHVQSLLHENLFHVKYRMSHIAFDKLLELLRPALTLKEKYAVLSGLEPISCEIMLHCALRYLSGGSYHDIRATCYISKLSFFRLLWHTIDAINACDALELWLPSTREELDAKRQGFKNISYSGVMDGCVGALDGYLLRITAPSKEQCGNVGAYYSGHYCIYGVNIQAMCDADCRFTFFAIAAPGKTNDSVAIRKTSLPAWLDQLPPGYFIAADCAYAISEHVIAPYSGSQRFLEKCDNFNFFLSQLRIRIEMAFGLLVTKWRILHIPINVKFSNLRKLVSAIVRLHNYCIDEREPTVAIQRMYKVAKNSHHAHEPTELGYIPSDAPSVISREGSSHLREILVRRVANNNLVRPVTVGTKVGLAQRRQAMYE